MSIVILHLASLLQIIPKLLREKGWMNNQITQPFLFLKYNPLFLIIYFFNNIQEIISADRTVSKAKSASDR